MDMMLGFDDQLRMDEKGGDGGDINERMNRKKKLKRLGSAGAAKKKSGCC